MSRTKPIWPGFMGEAGKIRFEAVPYLLGTRGLDLGCGPFKICNTAIGIDNGEDQSLSEHFGPIQAALSADVSHLPALSSNFFDFVFSSHTLEHIENWQSALKEWWRLVKHGGHLILYLPHPVLYELAQPGAGEKSGHKADIYQDSIIEVMKELGGWDLLRNEERDYKNELWYLSEYSFFMVFKKRADKRQTTPYKNRAATKNVAAFIRQGGIGDILVASSLLPELKKQGWHVRCFGSKLTYEVLRENPYIDSFQIDEEAHIRAESGEVNHYWNYIKDVYPVSINPWWTFEGLGIAHENDAAHRFWSDTARRNIFGQVNYLELAHIAMDTPFPAEVKFYPDKKAKEAARRFLGSIDAKNSVVVYVTLQGTGVHKIVPAMPEAIRMLVDKYPEVKVVLTGIKSGLPLQGMYEENERVYRKADKFDLHTALALSQLSDIVVGPETGTLNAVGMEEYPAKLIVLSHSNERNLCDHWVNYEAMVPDVDCHPCHMLHHKYDHVCKPVKYTENDPNNYARCAAAITAKEIFEKLELMVRSVIDRKKLR